MREKYCYSGNSHARGLGEEVLEGLQVGGGLAAVLAPGVLAPDRAGEAQLEQRVEVVVGGVEDLAEQPVDLVGVDRAQADPADQVDVADPVEGVVHAVEARVALQQEPVDDVEVLVGLAAHERLRRTARGRARRASSASAAGWCPAASPGTPRRPAACGRRPCRPARPRSSCRPAPRRSPGHPFQDPPPPRGELPRGAGVRVEQRIGGAVPGEAAGVLHRGPAQLVAPARDGGHHRQRVGPLGGAVPVDQQPGPAVGHRDRQATDVRRDHRGAAGLGLQRDQAERLVVAGHRDDVGRPEHPDQPVGGPGGRNRTRR